MTVTIELNANDFSKRCWSGAADTCKYLTLNEIQTILDILEDGYSNLPSLTEINDFFWFETETLASWLGYDSFEDIIDRDINKRR